MKNAARSCRGFTITEVLIATAIATMVLVMVFSLYRTVTRNNGLSGEDRVLDEAAIRAMEMLSRDLRCAFVPEDTNQTAFVLISGGEDSDTILFQTAEIPVGAASVDEYLPRRVEWLFEPGRQDAGVLVRSVSDPEERVPPQELRQGPGMRRLKISAFDGRQWHDDWPVDGARPLPLIVRVELEHERARENVLHQYTREVMIPAARTFRPVVPVETADEIGAP